jgi:hypothetical protein
MISWRLWLLLQHPPKNHPLFTRIAPADQSNTFERWFLRLPIVMAAAIISMIVLFAIGSGRGLVEGAPMLPIAIPILTSLSGFNWSTSISADIAKERESGHFELLATSPPGALGIGWIIGNGHLYKTQQSLYLFRLSMIFIATSMTTIFVLAAMLASGDLVPNADFIIEGLGTVGILLLDSIQSVVLAVIMGIYVSTQLSNRFEANVFGGTSFVFVQVVIYLLGYLIGYSLLPGVFADMGFTGWLAAMMLTGFRAALLLGLREMLVMLIWNHLVERLSTVSNLNPFSQEAITQVVG